MNTITKLTTSSVTNTKLAIATLAMLAAGGVAFAVAPLSKVLNLKSVGFQVKSCSVIRGGIAITKLDGRATTMKNGCYSDGNGKTNYYKYKCISKTSYSSDIFPCTPDVAFFNNPNKQDGITVYKDFVKIMAINQGWNRYTQPINYTIYWIDDSSGSEVVLGQQDVRGKLLANPNEIEYIVFPMLKNPAIKKVRVVLNTSNPPMAEYRIDNNQQVATVPPEFIPIVKLPDLIVSSITFDHLSTDGTSIVGYLTIKNIGEASAVMPTSSNGYPLAGFKVQTDSKDASGNVLETHILSPTETTITPGQEFKLGFGNKLANVKSVTIKADWQGGQSYIQESNESNNELSADIPSQFLLPDLIVRDFTFSDALPGYGTSTKQINIIIKNIGVGPAIGKPAMGGGAFTAQSFGIKSDGTIFESEAFDSKPTELQLDPGQEVILSFPINMPTSGLIGASKIKIKADWLFGDSFIKESDENNNELIKDVSSLF